MTEKMLSEGSLKNQNFCANRGVHGEFLFATQAWFHKSSIAADILGFEVSLDRQGIRPLGRC
jgi:hypothetical protein